MKSLLSPSYGRRREVVSLVRMKQGRYPVSKNMMRMVKAAAMKRLSFISGQKATRVLAISLVFCQ
jgi:hypothetical protein